MEILKPLLAGAVGTSFMTLYSYGSSRLRKTQYREPELLAQLIGGPEGLYRKEDLVKGWIAHYLVGSVFSFSYKLFLQGKIIQNPLLKGMISGGAYGLGGVLGWRAAFKAHPNPPKIDYTGYYKHLVVAHIIFGSFAFGLLEHQSAGSK